MVSTGRKEATRISSHKSHVLDDVVSGKQENSGLRSGRNSCFPGAGSYYGILIKRV